MSETVHYRGSLKEVTRLENESLEDQCKRLLANKDLPSYFDSYREMLLDESYKEYVVHDGKLYSVNREDVDPDGDIFLSGEGENGDINFEVRYYNGGCSFDEAIEAALKNMK